jgi:hypothetical protein
MGIKEKSEQAVGVTLLRPGAGARNIDLPEGSTLADLLRQENVVTGNSSIAIDGKELAEHLVLREGMVIAVAPQATNAASRRSWRDLMGDFHDDPVFEEIMQAIEDDRRAEKEQA